MDVVLYPRKDSDQTADEENAHVVTNIVRLEVDMLDDENRRWRVMILDADDTFDVVLEDPDDTEGGEVLPGEILWSLVRERRGAE